MLGFFFRLHLPWGFSFAFVTFPSTSTCHMPLMFVVKRSFLKIISQITATYLFLHLCRVLYCSRRVLFPLDLYHHLPHLTVTPPLLHEPIHETNAFTTDISHIFSHLNVPAMTSNFITLCIDGSTSCVCSLIN